MPRLGFEKPSRPAGASKEPISLGLNRLASQAKALGKEQI